MENNKVCTVAIVGLGSRGLNTYAQCALKFPEKMKIVAVADPHANRVQMAKEQFGLADAQCFDSAQKLLEQERLADVMFICTQDRQHVEQAIPAMKKGYHIVLEKPISPEMDQLRSIVQVAEETQRKVIVCHVLRYTPFYNKLKQLLDEGTVGEIVGIQHIENVGYWHQAHSFVRGNWRSSKETSPMIMAKCCHDLDLLLWLTGKHCTTVSSFGNTFLFRADKAPAGAAKRCLDGCKAKDSCPYDAEKIYITNEATGVAAGKTGWPCNVLADYPTEENIYEAIKTGPYGRCVYACDNDVVDHQVVNMLMEDGSALQMTMSAFNAHGGRETNILGTTGQIKASLDENIIKVMPYGGKEYTIDVSQMTQDFSGHAGGDSRMVEEFLDVVRGAAEPTSRMTTLEASVESHFIALAAERSRLEQGRSIPLSEISGKA